jgi:hypothetical protein
MKARCPNQSVEGTLGILAFFLGVRSGRPLTLSLGIEARYERMETKVTPIIFTPDNEPYLGRTLLFHFDQIISATMEQNSVVAKRSHDKELTDHQKMASQVISQSLSITLSIRELIRQCYLFGAYVLLRPLVERAMILFYLYYYPEDIIHWNNGWQYREAPGLSKMIDKISKKLANSPKGRGSDMLKSMNSLLHGKPDSAYFSLFPIGDSQFGFAASKILNRPKLCDDLCADVIPTLAMIQGMMAAYFNKNGGSGSFT